jgi:ATP-dependent Clp protease ATP-binding subunit ClpA
MFERFTERARQVVVLAQEEARTLKHSYIGTEHILLGLLREEEGLAARVLESLDITVERVRAQVVRIVGSGEEVTSGQIPFTPRAKKVLELALREALNLGHDYIGTEHILLGLLDENTGVAARILVDFEADSEKIRNEVARALTVGEADLAHYLQKRLAEDRRKQVLEDRLTRVWARRMSKVMVASSRWSAGVGSYLERRSKDRHTERFRMSGLLALEALKQTLLEEEQDRALSKEEFTEAIHRLDVAKNMLAHIRDEAYPEPEP